MNSPSRRLSINTGSEKGILLCLDVELLKSFVQVLNEEIISASSLDSVSNLHYPQSLQWG